MATASAPSCYPLCMNAEAAYLFRHALLREAAYQLQLPADRARLHRLCLHIIPDLLGAGVDSSALSAVAHELAEHARFAQDDARPEELEELRSLEVSYSARAAEFASTQFRNLDAASWHQRIAACPFVSGRRRVHHLCAASSAYLAAGRYVEAQTSVKQAMRLAESGTDQEALRMAHLQSASCLFDLDQRKDARLHAEQALRLTRALGGAHLAKALGTAAKCSASGDSLAVARAKLDEVLHLAREEGDARSEVVTLISLGLRLGQERDYHGAIEQLSLARDLARSGGFMPSEGLCLGNLGAMWLNLGQPARAVECFNAALELARKTGSIDREAMWLMNLAVVNTRNGNFEPARVQYSRAAALCEECGRPYTLVSVWINLGQLEWKDRRFGQAMSAFQRALGAAQLHQLGQLEAVVLHNMGQTASDMGDEAPAASFWKQRDAVIRQHGAPPELLRSLTPQA